MLDIIVIFVIQLFVFRYRLNVSVLYNSLSVLSRKLSYYWPLLTVRFYLLPGVCICQKETELVANVPNVLNAICDIQATHHSLISLAPVINDAFDSCADPHAQPTP